MRGFGAWSLGVGLWVLGCGVSGLGFGVGNLDGRRVLGGEVVRGVVKLKRLFEGHSKVLLGSIWEQVGISCQKLTKTSQWLQERPWNNARSALRGSLRLGKSALSLLPARSNIGPDSDHTYSIHMVCHFVRA